MHNTLPGAKYMLEKSNQILRMGNLGDAIEDGIEGLTT